MKDQPTRLNHKRLTVFWGKTVNSETVKTGIVLVIKNCISRQVSLEGFLMWEMLEYKVMRLESNYFQ